MSGARAAGPLTDREIEELAAAFDRLPDDAAIFDVQMADGYLAGALLQPAPVPADDCLPRIVHRSTDSARQGWTADEERRATALLRRRYDELASAIAAREAFDPIVFPFVDEASGEPDIGPAGIEALAPWAFGFSLALEDFPALLALDDGDGALGDLLLGIYRHVPAGPDTAEAAEHAQLLAGLPRLKSLGEAVEDIVGCVLEIADISRPREPLRRAEPKVGRNDPCPCGSGRKFKHCHGAA